MPTNKRVRLVVVLLVCLAGVTACGQKGDLYFPDEQGEQKVERDLNWLFKSLV